jgi:hypothetical protein
MKSSFVRTIGLATLYILAAPIYAIVGIRRVGHLWSVRNILTAGKITCPHCSAVNDLDVLSICGRCKTVEYGNRLRCSACRNVTKGFNCDRCTVTIWVL